MRRITLRTLVNLAVLTALEIVLSRFLSISTQELKIGFSFVPVVLAAALYGPLGGALCAGLGDLIGAVLFPIGPYFPGFTLTAALTGAVFGLFLHKKIRWQGTAAAVLINQLPLSLGLNTLWISLLYGTPYLALLSTRLLQCAILIPVQIIVILLLKPLIEYLKEHYI